MMPIPLVYLWWDPSPSPDVGGYNIYRITDDLPPVKVNAQPITGLFYADLVPGWANYEYFAKAVDWAENESGESNHAYVWWGGDLDLMASVDAGTPEASPYTQRRAGYYTWGSTPDSTVDYDPDSLVYRFDGLNRDSSYVLALGYFQKPNTGSRKLSLSVNGVPIHASIALPSVPVSGYFKVPKQVCRQGTLTLAFKRVQGPDVVLAKLSLYRGTLKGGGPQSSGLAALLGKNAALGLPSPNPAIGSAEVAYHLALPGKVSLKVYNVSGRVVRTLVSGFKPAGIRLVSWDGKDDSGTGVPGGVYFFRLQGDGFSETKKLVVLR